jgi:hypothetical protein
MKINQDFQVGIGQANGAKISGQCKRMQTNSHIKWKLGDILKTLNLNSNFESWELGFSRSFECS